MKELLPALVGALIAVLVIAAVVVTSPRPRAQRRTAQWETRGGIRITALANGMCLYEGPAGAYGVRSIAAVAARDMPFGQGCE